MLELEVCITIPGPLITFLKNFISIRHTVVHLFGTCVMIIISKYHRVKAGEMAQQSRVIAKSRIWIPRALAWQDECEEALRMSEKGPGGWRGRLHVGAWTAACVRGTSKSQRGRRR